MIQIHVSLSRGLTWKAGGHPNLQSALCYDALLLLGQGKGQKAASWSHFSEWQQYKILISSQRCVATPQGIWVDVSEIKGSVSSGLGWFQQSLQSSHPSWLCYLFLCWVSSLPWKLWTRCSSKLNVPILLYELPNLRLAELWRKTWKRMWVGPPSDLGTMGIKWAETRSMYNCIPNREDRMWYSSQELGFVWSIPSFSKSHED